MRRAVALVVGVLVILLVSGCTQTEGVTGVANKQSGNTPTYTPSDRSASTKTTAPRCDREAEAHREADRALAYCRANPYGTYRGDVCGVPIKIVC